MQKIENSVAKASRNPKNYYKHQSIRCNGYYYKTVFNKIYLKLSMNKLLFFNLCLLCSMNICYRIGSLFESLLNRWLIVHRGNAREGIYDFSSQFSILKLTNFE